MPQASIKHYFLPCRILHVNVQEMCKKKRENFYSAGTIPIHTCTSCQSDYQLSLPD